MKFPPKPLRIIANTRPPQKTLFTRPKPMNIAAIAKIARGAARPVTATLIERAKPGGATRHIGGRINWFLRSTSWQCECLARSLIVAGLLPYHWLGYAKEPRRRTLAVVPRSICDMVLAL